MSGKYRQAAASVNREFAAGATVRVPAPGDLE
jgi:hypothetical protein